MKHFSTSFKLVALASIVLASGCTHALKVRNLDLYTNWELHPARKPLVVGIITSETDPALRLLIKGIAFALPRYSVKVFLPYDPKGHQKVDAIARIAIHPAYRGSWWNFVINFPGYLLWVPALHGYVYKADYSVEIRLGRGEDDSQIASWEMPVKLDLRHADYNRTWTEISWLELGVIAFIGGLVFTGYDSNVTPILAARIQIPLGDYIAQEIVDRLNADLGASDCDRSNVSRLGSP